jgi:hypothetical protein
MMNLNKVDKSNIDILYELNFELAADEGQKDLFSVSKDDYSDAFLGNTPILNGYVLYSGDMAIGFYIYTYKFASYIGSKVIYIEDIHLTSKYRSPDNKLILLQHAIKVSAKEKCCRVELRMLKSFNIGYDTVESLGFKPVNKWEVYRLEK